MPGAEICEIKDIAAKVGDVADPDLITIFAGANELVDGDLVTPFEDDLQSLLCQKFNVNCSVNF